MNRWERPLSPHIAHAAEFDDVAVYILRLFLWSFSVHGKQIVFYLEKKRIVTPEFSHHHKYTPENISRDIK